MAKPSPRTIEVEGTSPRRFTHVRLLSDNATAWNAKRHLIANARHTLDLSYFILEVDGTTSWLLLDLIDAAARGVQVRLLVDYFTTFQQAAALRALGSTPHLQVRRFGLPTPTWLAALNAAGIDARAFVTGLMTASGPMLAASLKGNTIFGASVANDLHSLPPTPGEGGIGFPIQVLGALRAELNGAPTAAFELAADRDAALKKVALLIQILRGLKQFLHRNHHKLLLADGQWFVMGGRNLSDAYHCGDSSRGHVFQDTDLLAHDGCAGGSPHARSFDALWNSVQSADITVPDPLDANPPATTATFHQSASALLATPPGTDLHGGTLLPDMDGELVDNLPSDKGDPAITRVYIAQIERLRADGRPASVDIVSAYLFLTDEANTSETLLALRNTLLMAVAAGLIVNIYTNSLASTDLKPVNRAAYPKLVPLIEGGVNVFELADGQGSLHTKAAAIGDACLVVGSYNMDPRSELYDTNNLIVLQDPTGSATSAFRRTCIEALAWKQLTRDAARQLARESRTSPSAGITDNLL
ncbi:phosphatidylserine/phosphatidylglycerophosphate/cardiolipin synthase family protein [Variovorax sp. J22R133]|uniref:phosphatidylserine/phosphatidylglycerophosphate/ cardiolipin synthase family protein n=1 Tax=Variovorax brevis TaxID=3053503 RepID=UPI00257772CD|nr:phosphatidylserine/phosphatidylglycerophosphate/cardiolipin synthase family protein [Variovorax sp. J22R133]MDM0117911.1 phosphatidylserine/phosphatidylglycerophosphate/cardiolipin synthase family protein [Variovorax sp. J22R133]